MTAARAGATQQLGAGWMAAAVLGLTTLALLAYANSLAVPFVLDDAVSIVENQSIRKLWPPWAALMAPPRRLLAGRPAVNLSFAVNYALGGLDARGYHAVNLGLHVLSGLTLFGIVRRTLAGRALAARFAATAKPLALMVAAIWLVHPLQSEAVTYLTQRTELLASFFYLLTLYAAIRAWNSERARWWGTASVGCCALAMASKEMAVTAPVMVVLYDRVFVCASYREAWVRRRGLYAGLAATWGVLAALLAFYPHTDTIGFGQGMTPWEYAGTELGVVVRYLRLALWPDSLCAYYGGWVTRGARALVPPALLLSALVGGALGALARARPIGFLGAWVFGILVPTSTVVPIVTEVMAERRMYLPLAAIVALIVVGGYAILERLLGQRVLRWWIAAAVVIVLVVVLGALTVRRNSDYASELTILTDSVRKVPGNPRAQNNLGSELVSTGRLDAALPYFAEAVRLEPRYASAQFNLASALHHLGRVEEAIAGYEETLKLDPTYAEAHANLCSALLQTARVDDAVVHCREALRLDPGIAVAHNSLGLALRGQGWLEEAAAEFAEAVRLDPGSAQMQENLRQTRAALGTIAPGS